MKSIATSIITACCSITAWAQSPVLLKDINPTGDADPGIFIAYNNKTYFTADDGVNGNEIWMTDGTTAGTMLLKDIKPGSSAGVASLTSTILNGKIIFMASEGTTSGWELWTSDGTSSGTVMLKDINPGPGSSYPVFLLKRNSWELAVLGGKAFFFADNGVDGKELWVTDGTAAGTQLLKDINPGGVSGFDDTETDLSTVILNGKLYFTAATATTGSELWVTDGTSAGTNLLKDLNPGVASSVPLELTLCQGKIIFSAIENTSGKELWISDGTAAGTGLLKDINPGVGNSTPSGFQVFGNKVIFFAGTSSYGKEMWMTDGTTSGTQLLKDLNPGSQNGTFGQPYVMGNWAYFVGVSSLGRSLYKTDGTETGTTIVHTFDSDMNIYAWYAPIAYNNELYFQLKRTTDGWHLWKTDGTEAGTKLVAPDVAPNFNPLAASGAMSICNGALFYAANYTAAGQEAYMIKSGSTGLDNAMANAQPVQLYPSPASQKIFIEGLPIGTQFTLFNSMGQSIQHMRSQYVKEKIDIAALPSGIYFVRFDYKGSSRNIKFIKE